MVSNSQCEDRQTDAINTQMRRATESMIVRNQGAGSSQGTQVEVASPPPKPESLSDFRVEGHTQEKVSWSRQLEN